MEHSISRKQRRQRAWVRIILRKRIPALRAYLYAWGIRRYAKYLAGRNQKREQARVRRIKRAVAKQRIDPNRPCPACGARDGEIRFMPQFGVIIHRCKVCTALSPERPIVVWDDWKVEIDDRQVEPLQIIEAWQKSRMDAALNQPPSGAVPAPRPNGKP